MTDLLPDPALSVLVNQAEINPVFELSLTVNVKGATLSGMLVGEVRWFASVSRFIKDAGADSGLLDGLGSGFARYGDHIRESGGEVEHHFLHLIEARVVDGAGLVPPHDVVPSNWRTRLADVSGWTVGRIGPVGRIS